MEFITSRNLTKSAEDLRQCWLNLWRARLWPYDELVAGDVLYWHEAQARCIVWKTQVTRVERFPYRTKAAAQARIEEAFGAPLVAGWAAPDAPDEGFCLAFAVRPLEALRLPKPDGLIFPYEGWLRVDSSIARAWLGKPTPADDTTLDDAAPEGPVLPALQHLSTALADVAPYRVRMLVKQTLCCDSRIVRALKELCEYRCQFPGCGTRLPERCQVAHIPPIRRGSHNVLGSLLVLCPEHHAALAHGDLRVTEQSVATLRGSLNGQAFLIDLAAAGACQQRVAD